MKLDFQNFRYAGKKLKKACNSKEKSTKNTSIFCRNKPNSPIVQSNVTNVMTMNYTIFTSLTKVKNKPNSNPIKLVLECRSRGANFKQGLEIESKWTMQASLTGKSLDICPLNLFGSDNVTDAGVAK